MINKLKIKNKGFTLVEILVAVSLFIVVTFISIGAILTVFDANRKTQASKTVVDNLNLSIESMARTIRFGSIYHCYISQGNTSQPQDCPVNGKSSIAVTFYDQKLARNVIVTYEWDSVNKSIIRTYDGVNEGSITSPETVIDYFNLYVFGSALGPADLVQPYVIIVVKGHVGVKPTVQTAFSIETLISQRTLDL